jgi:hypothetical protein
MRKQRKLARRLGFFVVLGCCSYFLFTHKSYEKIAIAPQNTQSVTQANGNLSENKVGASNAALKIASASSTKTTSRKHPKKQTTLASLQKGTSPQITTSIPAQQISADEFNAGLGETELHSTPPSIQVDIRTGSIAPNYGIILDIVALPIKIAEQDLFTRFGIGAVKVGSEWKASLYLDELVYFKTDNPQTSFYAGAGVNLPLADEASLGLGAFVGIENKMSVFGNKQESLFLEIGASQFKINDQEDTHLNLTAGYKFTL